MSPELREALELLRYLWQEADLERDPSMGKVRDQFAPDDPLAVDIERVICRTGRPSPSSIARNGG